MTGRLTRSPSEGHHLVRMTLSNNQNKTTRWDVVRGPLLIYVAGFVIFAAVSGDRLTEHSRDNHYVYLADGLLHGRLSIDGKPPHLNDWAKYDDKWYVSFPPVPAFLMLPGVAVFGLDFNDRLFTLFFAAAGPALLFLLMQILVTQRRFHRKRHELYLLSALYGLGTVYFFCAVQGTVWYTAHMVGSVSIIAFCIASIGGRHPFAAGLFLALAFGCRPPMLLAFPFFLYELLGAATHKSSATGAIDWLRNGISSLGARRATQTILSFGLPIVTIAVVLMLMNEARFDDPFEFGHKHLQVRWTKRIETWGLFHYHFLARNLSIVTSSLPWLSSDPPYIGISRHGLALWFTTPIWFWLLWPAQKSRFYAALALTVAMAGLPSLLYQNSGWVQFGYRFSLDYTPFLILMFACGGRKMGRLFMAAALFSVCINTFGAITFDRHWDYYPKASTTHLFQPD